MYQDEEAYICIYSERNADVVLFHHQGGVDVGDVDEKALRLFVEVGEKPDSVQLSSQLLVNIQDPTKKE